MNKAILMGRLTADPELKKSPSGTSVAKFCVAVNRRFKNAQGGYDADFINCVAWRQTAEFLCKYFKKGSSVSIVGSIQTSSWEGTDEKRYYKTEINVEEIYFVGEAKKSGQNQDSLTKEPSPEMTNTYSQQDVFSQLSTDANDDDLPF